MMFEKMAHRGADVWSVYLSRHRGRLMAALALLVTIIWLRRVVYNSYFKWVAIPKNLDLCDMWKRESRDSTPTAWWQYVCLIERHVDGPKDYECKDIQMRGNYRVCYDEPYRPRDKDCLVYSFGINNEWQFDEAMAADGCTVYSFDPSMGMADHTHSERVYFKNIGIGAEDSGSFQPHVDVFVKHISQWKIRTLRSIMKELGHEKRTIDILKVDIEVYEWDVLPNILQDGLFSQVKQYLTEFHIFPNSPVRTRFKQVFDAYNNVTKAGLKFFFSEGNERYHHFMYFNSQADMSYVNTKYTPPE